MGKASGAKTTVGELANLVGGQVEGDPSVRITAARALQEAQAGDIAFVSGEQWREAAEQCRASALVVGRDFSDAPKGPALIRVDTPDLAFAKIVEHLHSPVPAPKPGIDSTAIIREDVKLGRDVSIGAGSIIESGAIVGDRTIIYPRVYIGAETQIGADCIIWPNVTIRERVSIGSRVIIHCGTVIGDDGFGYTQAGGQIVKIPQLGTVVIEDDVEIGSCVCIDRARFDRTYIGRSVKIDNLVQIGHNVWIGEGTIIVAQVGIAGSARVGKGCIIAGQAGLDDHITVGDGARIAARSAVSRSVPAGETVVGIPARPYREEMRRMAALRHVDDMRSRIKALEKQLAELQKKDSST